LRDVTTSPNDSQQKHFLVGHSIDHDIVGELEASISRTQIVPPTPEVGILREPSEESRKPVQELVSPLQALGFLGNQDPDVVEVSFRFGGDA
jgi:hypothetical protein